MYRIYPLCSMEALAIYVNAAFAPIVSLFVLYRMHTIQPMVPQSKLLDKKNLARIESLIPREIKAHSPSQFILLRTTSDMYCVNRQTPHHGPALVYSALQSPKKKLPAYFKINNYCLLTLYGSNIQPALGTILEFAVSRSMCEVCYETAGKANNYLFLMAHWIHFLLLII